MSKHGKVYMRNLSIGPEDVVLCEVCGKVAVDIHHVLFKSQGGTDDIDNLIALCRGCHDISHGKIKDKEFTREYLWDIANERR